MTSPIAHILQIKKEVVFKCDLEKWENNIDYKVVDGLSVEDVSSQNIKDVQKFRGESVLQTFRKFYADGCYGAYAYLEGVVVGHAWMEINNTQMCRLSKEGILLLPGEGGIWYENVNEKYRGKQIINSLLNRLYETANVLGCKKLITHVLKDNEASIRSHRRFLGMNFASSATILRIMLGLVVIYKSCGRWFVLLALPRLRRRIGLAWSKPYGFGLLLSES